MFPQFGATAQTLSQASTLMFRIGTDAHLYDDPDDVSISPLLDSKFDSERVEALKRLLALIAQGGDVSNFFPQVVKNVATHSLEVKKLVYLYLLHYAEKRPNEALLSINCFQKDLGDTNPLVRAWALRAMAGIRLHVVAPLVLVAVSKCARDPSVYVRKCAANALPKLYDLRIEENTSVLEEVLVVLLNDHSPGVVGTAAAAFAYICPNNLSLLGRSYRRLCEVLPDVEEWGQIALIGILLRYVVARHGLARESIMYSSYYAEGHSDNDGSGDNYPSDKDGLDINFAFEKAHNTGSHIYDAEIAKMISRCYIEGPDYYLSRLSCIMEGFPHLDAANFTSCKGNDDVNILLKCTSPLLWSHNSAVVIAASAVHWIMGAVQDVNKIVKPLLFLLRSSAASRYVALCNIQLFAKAMPSLFSPYFEDFLISSSDSYEIKALKLEILSFIATESSISIIFQEFQDYIRDPDRRFAADTVAAIGLCAQRHPKVVNICLDGLLSLIHEKSAISDLGIIDGEANVLIQAVMSLKGIIKQDPCSHEKVIALLVRSLDSIKVSAARAIIIWMVGEYNCIGEIIPRMLPIVLRYLARCFSSEVLETKLQILNTAIKVLLYAKGENLQTFEKVLSYVLDLAKCDFNYDVRDRARMIKQIHLYSFGSQSLEGLNGLPEGKNLSQDMWKQIFCGKSDPSSAEPTNYRFYLPGSLSQIVFHAAPGYEPLPRPCSLLLDDVVCRTGFDAEVANSDFYETDDSGSFSGSSDGESTSHHSSQRSIHSSSGSGSNADTGLEHGRDNTAGPLIHFSDVGNDYNKQTADSLSGSDNLDGLMSKRALESWLDEQPGFSNMDVSTGNQVCQSARISIGDITGRIRSKTYTLLDPANGSGLKVVYSFSSEVSSISPLLVCLEVSFRNFSSESMTKIAIVEDSNRGLGSGDQMLASTDSNLGSDKDMPVMVPMDEIEHLEPEEMLKMTLHVCFRHHLLPLKLALWCNDKKYPVKMWPDIGYFVKPLPVDIDEFRNKESHLPGMFEYMRRCTFTDHIAEISNDKDDMSPTKDKFLIICQSLAIKMLSNANVHLVSVDLPVTTNLDDATGLCLRFSSEILSNSFPCLITLTTEGKCCDPLNVSVKVNCEETVFGLNLLNRIINFLVELLPQS